MVKKISFGQRVKELRLAKEIGLRELGRLVDISAMHISNLEKERVMPSPELVTKVAQTLDGDADELLHLAKLVDPKVVDVIQDNPYQAPSLLRSAKNLTPEQWEKLQKQAEKMAKQNEKGK